MQFSEILVQPTLVRVSFQLPGHMTSDELQYMRNMAKSHFDQITNILKRMPRSLLLVIRYIKISFLSSIAAAACSSKLATLFCAKVYFYTYM